MPPPLLHRAAIISHTSSSSGPFRACISTASTDLRCLVSDIAIFVLKRDVKLQLTHLWCRAICCVALRRRIRCACSFKGSSHYARIRYNYDDVLTNALIRAQCERRHCFVCLSVCLSVCPRPHAYTIARTRTEEW